MCKAEFVKENFIKTILLVVILFLSLLTYGQGQIGSDIMGEAIGDQSGVDISMNNEGTIIAVGAARNTNNVGHVRIYERSGDDWVQLGADIDGDEEGGYSGSSVSINGDGTIVAVGGSSQGYAKVFTFIAGNWEQVGSNIDVITGDTTNRMVSLSDDGKTVAVGAPDDATNGTGAGRATFYTYDEMSNVWQQLGVDIYGDASGDNFGEKLSINGHGSRCIIGASGNDGNGNLSGQIKVYQWEDNTGWNQLGQSIYGAMPLYSLGESVSINSDGTRIAVGASTSFNEKGHIEVYDWDGVDSWIQSGSDIVGESYSRSGSSVSLNAVGDVLAVGAPWDSPTGYVKIYKKNPDRAYWIQLLSTVRGVSDDNFGFSTALNAEGNILATGSEFSDNYTGVVRVSEIDIVAPSGYAMSIDTEMIDDSNKENFRFTITDGKVGSTYVFVIGDPNDLNMITINGSGDVISTNQTISGIDVSDLPDGIFPFTLYLRDTNNNQGANITGTVMINTTLSIDKVDQNELLGFYPNPTKGDVSITFPMNSISIYNVLGKKVFETKENNFDVSFLKAGMYLVQVEGDKREVVKTLIKY